MISAECVDAVLDVVVLRVVDYPELHMLGCVKSYLDAAEEKVIVVILRRVRLLAAQCSYMEDDQGHAKVAMKLMISVMGLV